MALCGGFSAQKEVDDETRALFESSEVLARVNSLLSSSHSALKVLSFKTQVVAGVNFQVLVDAGGSKFTIHAHKPLPHTGAPLDVKAVNAGEWV